MVTKQQVRRLKMFIKSNNTKTIAAAKAGMDKERLEVKLPRLDEIPFQSEKQYMATLHPRDGGRVVYLKGSAERLLALSKSVLKDGRAAPLREPDKQIVIAAGEGSKASLAAYRYLTQQPSHSSCQ